MKVTIFELIRATGLSRVKLAKLFGFKSRQNLSYWNKNGGVIPNDVCFKMLTGNTEQRAAWRLLKAYRKRIEQNPNYGKKCDNHPNLDAVYRKQIITNNESDHHPDFSRLPQFLCEECGEQEYLNEPSRVKKTVQKLSSFENTLLANEKS